MIAEAGISKGAFYHYFASKEELLASLAGRFAQRALRAVQDVFGNHQMDALAQLNGFLERTWRFKLRMAPASWPIFTALYRPENLHLYHRITAASIELFRPPVTRIVVSGARTGIFKTFDPEGVAEMLLQLPVSTYPLIARAAATTSRKQWNEVIAALARRLRMHGIAIDRLLGLPDGSVRLADPSDVQAIMKVRSFRNR